MPADRYSSLTPPAIGQQARAKPLLFGLNMLLHTPAGDVFTMREYREWLKEAGFS
ncbi:MAG: hypothetical protein WB580_01090 [Candidatus Binataceae bacterium]